MNIKKKTSLIDLTIGLSIFVGVFLYFLLVVLYNKPNQEDNIIASILSGFVALIYYSLLSWAIRILFSKGFWEKLDVIIGVSIFAISFWYSRKFFAGFNDIYNLTHLVFMSAVVSITVLALYTFIIWIIRNSLNIFSSEK